MADKNILHMVTPLKHMSPFDVNMALDAGYDAIATYPNVLLEEITPLVQDAIFSRPPKVGARTGLFIGGKNAILALDMLDAAKKALVPPFEISMFADPAGSFTTAAAMVAVTRRVLSEKKSLELNGLRVAVFGATGVVGFSSAVIAAAEGAEVTLVGYDGTARVKKAAEEIARRFDVRVDFADGSTPAGNDAVVKRTQIVFCAAKAGVRVLSAEQISAAPDLLVAADVNAVPPPGIEGLEATSDGGPIGETAVLGIGPLAIGRVKYETQSGLFKKMIAADKAVRFDFRDAYAFARDLTA